MRGAVVIRRFQLIAHLALNAQEAMFQSSAFEGNRSNRHRNLAKGRRSQRFLDMWATNLFLMTLPEINKKESKTNCMIALMDVDDGIMKEQLLIFDTTKLWMHGNIEVDFRQEQVQLSLFPHSKTARIYSLESPMRIAGYFSDIKLAVTPVDVAATPLPL